MTALGQLVGRPCKFNTIKLRSNMTRAGKWPDKERTQSQIMNITSVI